MSNENNTVQYPLPQIHDKCKATHGVTSQHEHTAVSCTNSHDSTTNTTVTKVERLNKVNHSVFFV